MLNKKLFTAILLFVTMIGLIFLLLQEVRFLISETNSLKQSYFLHFPKIAPKAQNYTLVWSDWYQGLIIKKIVGLEGDQIWFDSDLQMFINDFKVGKCKSIATDGRPLHPLNSQTIPKDQVFLHASHGSSFDSRYQELGLLFKHQLQGLVIPII